MIRTKRSMFVGLALPILVGIALRLFMVFQLHAPWGDNGAAILDVAKNITTGRGFTTQRIWTFHGQTKEFGQPEGNRQPLLPLCVAGARLSLGSSFRSAQVVPMVFGIAAMILIATLAWRLAGISAGLMAAWLAALDPLQIYFSAQIEDQIVFLVLFLILCLWLVAKPGTRPGGNPIIPALILALLYLTRANGILFLFAYLAIAAHRRQGKHAGYVIVLFLLISSPWLIRNIRAFGNPFHTDNAYFLWTDEFWKVFSIRPEPPSALEYLKNHTVIHLALRWFRGAYLCLEDFLHGNLFKQEPFAGGTLVIPILLAAIGFAKRKNQPILLFVGASFVLHFIALAWHAHGTFRYFMPFFVFLMVGASGGIVDSWHRWIDRGATRIKVLAIGSVFLFLFIPLIRPVAKTFRAGDLATHREAMEVIEWIEEESNPNMVIMDFPIIEKYVYLYDMPTIMTPYGSLEEIWSIAREYDVTHLIICAEQLARIPSLRTHWDQCGAGVIEIDPPPFLKHSFSSGGQKFLVYRFIDDYVP